MTNIRIEVYETGPERDSLASYWGPTVPRVGEEIILSDFEGGYVVLVKQVQHITLLDRDSPRYFDHVKVTGAIIRRSGL